MQGFVTRMDAGLTRFLRTACLGGGVAWTEIRCAAVSPFDGTVFAGGLTRIKDNFPGVAGSVQQKSGGGRETGRKTARAGPPENGGAGSAGKRTGAASCGRRHPFCVAQGFMPDFPRKPSKSEKGLKRNAILL